MAKLIPDITKYVGFNILANPALVIQPVDAAEKVITDAAILTNETVAIHTLVAGKKAMAFDKSLDENPIDKEIKDIKGRAGDSSLGMDQYDSAPNSPNYKYLKVRPPLSSPQDHDSSQAIMNAKVPRKDLSEFNDSTLYHLLSIPKNTITIVDIDCQCDPNSPYRGIELQGVPLELDYSPESNVVGIASIGRNNPHYHMVGGEDTLEMVIDWYAMRNDHLDVITKCRWLEALTKNDGYLDTLHRVMINWGNWELLDDGSYTLFDGMVWILVKAPYKLNTFNSGYLEDGNVRGRFISTALRPKYATQHLTFKRLTEYNLRRGDIMFPETGTWSDKFEMSKKYKSFR